MEMIANMSHESCCIYFGGLLLYNASTESSTAVNISRTSWGAHEWRSHGAEAQLSGDGEWETHPVLTIWGFPEMVVPPKSSILIGFSIINHPFWGTTIFGNTHDYIELLLPLKNVWKGKHFFPFLKWSIFPLDMFKILGVYHYTVGTPQFFWGGCIKLHQRDMLCFIGDWNGFINVGSSNVAWNLGVVELLNMTCIDIFRWLEIWSLRIFGYVSCALGMQWMVTGYKSWIYVLYHHMFCYDLYYSIELLYTKTICTVKIQERAKVQ